jgi:hypothetical protein
MRPGGLVVAVLLFTACKDKDTEKKTDPPAPKAAPDAAVPVAPGGDPVFAKALAARTAPVFELAPQETAKVGRCAVEIEARAAAEGARVLAEFDARNGPGWTTFDPVPSIDEYNGYLTFRIRDVPEDATAVVLDAAGATEVAAQFLALNHDLLGLDADDVKAATVDAAEQRERSKAVWEIRIVGKRPRPGYERFERVNREWRAFVDIGRDGKPRGINAQTFTLPPFEVCTEPTITPDAAKKAVIGYTPKFGNVSGEMVDGETVTADSIKSVAPVLHVWGGDDNSRIVRIAYFIETTSGMWSYVVDGETGEILDVRQNFST